MTGRWMILIVTVAVGLFGASMLVGADVVLEKSIEKAKEKREQDIEKASAAYYRQVEKANATLGKAYESAAGAAKRKKDEAKAESLAAAAEKAKAGESVDAGLAAGEPQLEVATKRHATELEAADRTFKLAVKQASTSLEQAYNTAITTYKRKSDPRAEELATELAAIKAESASPARPAPPEAKAGTGNPQLIKEIGATLINAEGKVISPKSLSHHDYVLLYFTASWCDGCRERTRELVKLYNDNASKEKFEVVFVSSCKSEKEMMDHMVAEKMPWPAVPYDKIDSTGLREKYSAVKVPLLIVLDKEGKVISKPGQYSEDVIKEFKMKIGAK